MRFLDYNLLNVHHPFPQLMIDFVCVWDIALKALQERFMKHIMPAPRPKRERTLQLNVVRKDSAPSGQEELRSESITITVNEGEDEPANVKPGTITIYIIVLFRYGSSFNVCIHFCR